MTLSLISVQKTSRGEKNKEKNKNIFGNIDANILYHLALLYPDFTEYFNNKTLTDFNSKMFSLCTWQMPRSCGACKHVFYRETKLFHEVSSYILPY